MLDLVSSSVGAGIRVDVFSELGSVPPFDASIPDDAASAAVRHLRAAVADADGVLFASPEYAHSVPGVLKNALDWLVGSGELANKPVAIITVSTTPTGGLRAQVALIQTLLAQSAEIVALLPIGSSRMKTDDRGAFVDPATVRRIHETLNALVERCRER